MPVAHVGNVTLAYEDLGNGEPALLCLPGWCAGRGSFHELLPMLAQSRRSLSMDWRGHGESSAAVGDFGSAELVADAIAVIEAAGVDRVVPVATAHAGWVAIELRRRLGARIPGIVLADWIVTDPPPPFIGALAAMADPANSFAVRDQLFAMWTDGVTHDEVKRFVREDMGAYPPQMWARAAREISGAYAREGNPLRALAALAKPPAVLHLYSQPADPGYLAAQEAFAAANPWFSVRRLGGRSHFPTIELPQQVRDHIETFMAATMARPS